MLQFLLMLLVNYPISYQASLKIFISNDFCAFMFLKYEDLYINKIYFSNC